MALPSKLTGGRIARLLRWLLDERGNVGAVMAVLLVPIVGALSMGVETSSWFLIGRAAQNAADSAAVAAANNADSTSVSGTLAGTAYNVPRYRWEGWANAKQYGFVNGSNNVTVAVVSGQTCPDGTATCYKATVTKVVPMYMARIVGFRGDTTIGTQKAKTIKSVAYAEPVNAISFPSCTTAVGSDSTAPNGNKYAISGDGTPNASGPGCSLSAVGPSSSIGCNGHDLGAYYGFSTGGFNGSGNLTCTANQTTDSNFTFCDPYSASPAAGCPSSTYATAISNAVSSAPSCVAAPSNLSGTLASSACYNTNLTLSGAVSGPNSNGAVIVMTNGATVDINSFSATNVTFIFTKGTATAPGSFTGKNSAVTLSAPTDGTLNGIAAYQVATSACTQSSCDNWTVNGGRTVDITGVIYLPYTNGSFGGATSTGHCFISIFNTFSVNGTGNVLDRSNCTADGVTALPTVLRYRAALVK